MIHITLPDGRILDFDAPPTALEVAATIGAGLAKATVAAYVNDVLQDARLSIDSDAHIRIVTTKDPAALEIIRHSCAHLLGHAVKQLFPDAKMTIGPVVEKGFYYDIACSESFSPDTLEQINKRMAELIGQDYDVDVRVVTRDEARRVFKERDEPYKLEIIDSIPDGETIKLYYHQEYIDMCRGPHVPNTRFLKAFKLMKLAGAYWRGDSEREMLQRVYGTAWINQKELDQYLFQLAEAEKRDHRRIGKQLDWFHTQEEAPGMIFWHPKGWSMVRVLEDYIRKLQIENGYLEIKTPQIIDRKLWEKSGHWEKFKDDMFTTASEHREFAVKPMNCPGHIQVFNQGIKSYRDLPMRFAEFGACHRNEPSGTLHGLMRVRHFTQDDAHIFCTPDQVQSEVSAFIDLVFKVYADFGFEKIEIKLSTRPPKRVGSDEVWDKAEQALEQALNAKNLEWQLLPGEGAFYGPKIEFSLRDSLDRVWQCGTIQVDFSMPDRLEASYVDETGSRQVPVMLHRAILGSFERFLGILIEESSGQMPFWLAPVQLVVMNITDRQREYCEKITQELRSAGFRVEVDLRNEKIGYKIREHTVGKIPYLAVIGDREVEAMQIALRQQDGKDLGSLSMSDLITRLKSVEANHGRS